MVVPLSDHTALAARQGYRQWIKVFGPPRKLLCDLGREFQKQFEDYAEADGTELLPSSLETPEGFRGATGTTLQGNGLQSHGANLMQGLGHLERSH